MDSCLDLSHSLLHPYTVYMNFVSCGTTLGLSKARLPRQVSPLWEDIVLLQGDTGHHGGDRLGLQRSCQDGHPSLCTCCGLDEKNVPRRLMDLNS